MVYQFLAHSQQRPSGVGVTMKGSKAPHGGACLIGAYLSGGFGVLRAMGGVQARD